MKTASKSAERLAWARQACLEQGLRRTPAREVVLDFLAAQEQPVTLAQIGANKSVRAQCDPATVFRTLQTLEGLGLLRRIWLHERTPYYILLFPGDHRDYVLCTGCGKVEETRLACPVQSLEKEVAAHLGYVEIRHELGFYGLCPSCQKKPGKKPENMPAKPALEHIHGNGCSHDEKPPRRGRK